MDLDELRSVRQTERSKDSLQHLRDDFYEAVATYVAERKRERDERAASADAPFSDPEVRKLSDELDAAEAVAESLYERRVGKIVKLASFAAADAPVDTDGMTARERDLFADLVARIEENRESVLAVLEGGSDVDLPVGDAPDAPGEDPPARDADAAGTTEPPSTPRDDPNGSAGSTAGVDSTGDASRTEESPGGGVLADAMGGDEGPTDTDGETDHPGSGGGDRPGADASATGSGASSGESSEGADPADGDAAGEGTDRRTVRITRDVGRILGVDEREYELAAEDVVTLPTANAEPLVERDAAEPLE